MNKNQPTDQIYDLADKYLREKRYEDAIALYKKLIEKNPREDSLVMSLSWAYRESGRIDDAIDCLEKLLKKELERKVFTGFAFDELVKIFKDEGKHDRLVDICERAVTAQSEDIDLLSTLGDAYLRNGQTDKAVEVYKRIISIESNSSVFFMNLGNALVAAGDFDGAEREYDMAVTMDPPEAPFFYGKLGNAYLKAGQYEKSGNAYRKSLRYEPENSFYYCNLGDVLVKQGKLEEANAAYENAVRINPESEGTFYNRFGNTLAMEHHRLEAIDIFKKAISVDPHNLFYYLRLAECCVAEGFIEMAEEALQRAKMLGEET